MITARSKKVREAYLASPNVCQQCQQPILPRPGEAIYAVKIRTFCSNSCAASRNN
jgi:hypothetical protein